MDPRGREAMAQRFHRFLAVVGAAGQRAIWDAAEQGRQALNDVMHQLGWNRFNPGVPAPLQIAAGEAAAAGAIVPGGAAAAALALQAGQEWVGAQALVAPVGQAAAAGVAGVVVANQIAQIADRVVEAREVAAQERAAESRLVKRSADVLDENAAKRLKADKQNYRGEGRATRPGGPHKILKRNMTRINTTNPLLFNRTSGSGRWETHCINPDATYGAQYTANWMHIADRGTASYERRGDRVNLRAVTFNVTAAWKRVGAATSVAPDAVIENAYFDYWVVHDVLHRAGETNIDLSEGIVQPPTDRKFLDVSTAAIDKYRILKQGRFELPRQIMRSTNNTVWTFPVNYSWVVKVPLGPKGLDHRWPNNATESNSSSGSGAAIFIMLRASDEMVESASTNDNNSQWNVWINQHTTYIDYNN